MRVPQRGVSVAFGAEIRQNRVLHPHFVRVPRRMATDMMYASFRDVRMRRCAHSSEFQNRHFRPVSLSSEGRPSSRPSWAIRCPVDSKDGVSRVLRARLSSLGPAGYVLDFDLCRGGERCAAAGQFSRRQFSSVRFPTGTQYFSLSSVLI